MSLAQMEEQTFINKNGLDNLTKKKEQVLVEQIKELFKQFSYEIGQMSRVDVKTKKSLGDKVTDNQDDWLKEDKVPVTIQTFTHQSN